MADDLGLNDVTGQAIKELADQHANPSSARLESAGTVNAVGVGCRADGPPGGAAMSTGPTEAKLIMLLDELTDEAEPLDEIAPREGMNLLALVMEFGLNAVKQRLALIAVNSPGCCRRVPENLKEGTWLTAPR